MSEWLRSGSVAGVRGMQSEDGMRGWMDRAGSGLVPCTTGRAVESVTDSVLSSNVTIFLEFLFSDI